jgi:putative FmdB family regulatory protein
MPTYEFLCRTCDCRFEARRSMSEADAPLLCPEGHPETTRVFSVFSSMVPAGAGGAAPAPAPMPKMGGCGTACGCH